ncbi:MAG: hypothetical protein ACI30R_07635 [Sodaliphilus sp.]
MKCVIKYLMVCFVLFVGTYRAFAEVDVDYEGTFTANFGKGDLAPYYINANRGGTVTQQHSALVSAAMKHNVDTTERFSYGFGAELWAGLSSALPYEKYHLDKDAFIPHDERPAYCWVQQLYADVKYRSLFATLGAKARHSEVVDAELSSGDLVMSGNARPGAGVAAGFINYQTIPYTKGWLQISGEISYERLSDGDWLKNHYNYYNNFITTGYWFHYKQMHLRTRPDRPVVLTIGAQAACQFGGTWDSYENGILVNSVKMPANFKSFFRAIVAGSGGDNPGDQIFVEGNHVGSWDMMLEYKHPTIGKMRAYHQTIWEDGSGIGLQNGFDGLWGIEWKAPGKSIVSGAVVEYLDFTNQSGRIHFSKEMGDASGIEGNATGYDNYYNNYCYNGYHNRGMSIGSPFLRGVIYNTDGYLRYTDNLLRGFHIGLKGDVTDEINYRLLFSYRKGWGTAEMPRMKGVSATCFLVEANARLHWLEGFDLRTQFAFDRGSLLGNNTGWLVSIRYSGNFNIGK